jgi:hypothetical protein
MTPRAGPPSRCVDQDAKGVPLTGEHVRDDPAASCPMSLDR